MTDIDIDDLLKDDNILPELNQIKYPTRDQKIVKENPKGTYIFENNEQFKGRIKKEKKGIKLLIGIYRWPNGQQYLGDLSANNNFTKRGTIIFPSNNKLIGNFIMKENKIKNAVYETATRKYEGSFVNSRLDGRFIIKNKENSPHYLFKGGYSNGRRQGNFILERVINEKILQTTGTFDKGKKNGLFKVYLKLKEEEEKMLIYEKSFINDKIVYTYSDKEKIENKVNILFDVELQYKICCLKTIKYTENKIFILLGSYENILIFDINNLNTPRPILIFKKADVNDILQLKDGKLLFCSSENNFKLIEPIFFEEEEEIKEESALETKTDSTGDDIKIIQEFKGLSTSKSIFVMKQLSNGLIASGDSENLILWKNIENNKFYEYNIINHIKLTNTYCILEIIKENKNKNVILSITQPDSKSVLFININNYNKIELIKKLDNINTIHSRKNIMKQENNKNILYIGCQNSIIIISLINYEIISKIFFDKITWLNQYLNKFLLCGIIKIKNSYSYEGYLTQIQMEMENKKFENVNIINVSKSLNMKHKGNIIDGDIITFEGKDTIITIGTDNKLIIFN